MVRLKLTFPPSQTIQTIVEAGAGRVISVTLTHDLPAPQVIAFYDRHNLRIMEYEMRPIGFPCAITLANRDAFTFDNGLKVNTGHCELQLAVAY